MIHLVLGGTRSGKSAYAEGRLGLLAPPHAYIATWIPDSDDVSMTDRIEGHRRRRSARWAVHEIQTAAELAPLLAGLDGSVMVDGLGTWLAAGPVPADEDRVIEALHGRSARGAATIVVSEEVGSSLHAPTAVGRAFVDRLGLFNQAVAAVAHRVTLVVAGRPLELGAAAT